MESYRELLRWLALLQRWSYDSGRAVERALFGGEHHLGDRFLKRFEAFKVILLFNAAHTTLFTDYGWHYLWHGEGTGLLKFGGSYVALTDSAKKQLTIVIETMVHLSFYGTIIKNRSSYSHTITASVFDHICRHSVCDAGSKLLSSSTTVCRTLSKCIIGRLA